MIEGVRHSGIVVTNMDNSLEFYRDLLGLKVVLDVEQTREFFDRLLGLPNVQMRVVMLEAPDGYKIELFEFPSHPQRPREDAEMSDIGCSHVAFTVDDVDKIFEEISSKGYKVNCPPQVSPDGYAKVIYCHDSDGTIIELVQILNQGLSPYGN